VSGPPAWSRHALALGVLALLTGLVLAPSWRSGHVIGAVDTDVWPHVWGFWWVGESLATGDGLPFETHLLKHPAGGSLFFPDLAGALLSVPLQAVVSLEAAFDGVLALKLFLVGLGGYLLAWLLCRDRLAATVAGACLLTAPYLLAEAHNGISENLNVGWLVLFVAGLVGVGRGRIGAGLGAGAMFAATFLGSWYYALGGLLLGALWLVDLLMDRERHSWRSLASLALAGAVAAAVVLPLAAVISGSLEADEAIVARDHRSVAELFESTHNAVDPLRFVAPGDHHSPDFQASFGENFFHVSYLGWLLLVSAFYGVWRARARIGLWISIAVTFLVLSLGPFLYVGGEYVVIRDHLIQLPFYFVFEYLPYFDLVGHPQRFVPLALIGLLALAAHGWADLSRRGRWGKLALVALAAAILVENLAVSPAPYPLPTARLEIDPHLEELGEQGGTAAVLDLPARFSPRFLNTRYFYLQTAHRRPIVHTLNGPFSTLHLSLGDNTLVQALLAVEFPDDGYPTAGDKELRLGAELLWTKQFDRVIVHRSYYGDDGVREATEELLTLVLGPPAYESALLAEFPIPAVVETTAVEAR
jgi:hypothetical protein